MAYRTQPATTPNNKAGVPLCVKSTVCDSVFVGLANRNLVPRVLWRQTATKPPSGVAAIAAALKAHVAKHEALVAQAQHQRHPIGR